MLNLEAAARTLEDPEQVLEVSRMNSATVTRDGYTVKVDLIGEYVAVEMDGEPLGYLCGELKYRALALLLAEPTRIAKAAKPTSTLRARLREFHASGKIERTAADTWTKLAQLGWLVRAGESWQVTEQGLAVVA